MKAKLIMFAAVSQIALTAQAHAQAENEAAQEVTPQQAPTSEIVVTARRREEVLQDVPISISALDGAALTAQGVNDALTLQNSVPSLSVTTQAPNRVTLGYALRGQRTNESQLLTDPPVGIYFAEAVMPRSYGFSGQFFDLQNVQVLKGVQGTLFGRNMTGGAVLVEPAHPDLNDIGVEATAQYGNYNMVDVQGMVNLPIVDGVFGIRLAGKYRDRDGFTTEISSGRRYDDEHYYSLRASAELDTGAFRNYTVFDYTKSDTNGTAIKMKSISLIDPRNGSPTVIARLVGAAPFFPVAAGAPPQDVLAFANAAIALGKYKVDYGAFGTGPLYPDRVSRDPFQHAENWGITNRTELDVGEVTFRNIFNYRKQEFNLVSDYDGTGAALIQPNQFSFPRQISEEFQVQGTPFGDALNLTAGAYYFHEWGKDGSVAVGFPQLVSIGYASNPNFAPLAGYFLTQPAQFYEQSNIADTDAYSWAVYLAGTLDLTDEFSLAGGIRYNRDAREVTLNPFLTTFSLPPGIGITLDQPCVFNGLGTYSREDCPQSRTLKNEAVTWDFTAQFEPNPDLTAYAAIRKGYRAGGFSLRATSDITLAPFQPESVLEYEIGMKNNIQIGSGTLNSSIALYYQDYTDVQKQITSIMNNQVVTLISNTTAQENYGGEFEASLAFANGLSFNLFYAYTGINITKGDNGGYTYQGISKHQLGGGITFADDIGPGMLTMNVNGNYRSGQYLSTFDPGSRQPGYALFNARIALDDIAGSGIGVAGFARNITNEYFAVGGIALSSSGPVINGVNPGGGAGYASYIYGDPRTYGIEVSAKF